MLFFPAGVPMKTIFSDDHRLQNVPREFFRGEWVEAFENPRRAEIILAEVKRAELGPVLAPDSFGMDEIGKVHDPGLVAFLESFWPSWVDEVGDTPAYPGLWPPPRSRRLPTRRPGAELGRYAVDTSSPVVAGTWQAVRSAVNTALTGAGVVMSGARSAFALCRPPGHHAGRDYFGGYCFLNNAAIAAQFLRDQGAGRVGMLDIDYHHGNGTQDIFYARADVLTVSIHADPRQEYPYYLGFADETGADEGEGFNVNHPLPWGADFTSWSARLDLGLDRLSEFSPDMLIVSLGVDTFEDDPISQFRLKTSDYLTIGQRIASLGMPTLFVMEGGYAIEALGRNAVSVLTGFEAAC